MLRGRDRCILFVLASSISLAARAQNTAAPNLATTSVGTATGASSNSSSTPTKGVSRPVPSDLSEREDPEPSTIRWREASGPPQRVAPNPASARWPIFPGSQEQEEPYPLAATPSTSAGSTHQKDPSPDRLDASVSSDSLTTPAARPSNAIMAVQPVPVRGSEPPRFGLLSKAAMGFQVTSLGIGASVATPLTTSFNLRFAANLINLGYGFQLDGAAYNFDLRLRSEQLSVEWMPFRGNFHVSPGVLIYNSNIMGGVNVPASSDFRLGGTPFTSSPADPIHGTATFVFSHALMPSLMFGFGNIVPRSGKRLTFPFEIGAAYMGHNQVNLNLQGTVCSQGYCLSTSDPVIQQDVLAEQNQLNESVKRLQAYPILSSGVAYRF